MGLIEDALSAVWGLLVNGVLLTIPIAVCTIILLFLFNFIQKKTRLQWIGAAVLTLFVGIAVFFFAYNLLVISHGITDTNTSQIPPDIRAQTEYAATETNWLGLLGRTLVQSVLTGIIFTLILLPFAFLGVATFEQLKPRIKGVWPRIILTCFFGALLLILLVSAFPWIPVSLVYLAFFGL